MFFKIFAFSALFVAISADVSSKIAGGEYAELGQFPWHAHIITDSVFFRLMCGGALIRPKWVLTAALCLLEANDVTLYFGMIDRLSDDIGKIVQVSDSEHMFLHPDYDGFNVDNPFDDNIGLIYLDITYSLLDIPHVDLVRLPVNYAGEDFLHDAAIATGFGVTDDPPTGPYSQYMKFVSMPVIDNESCNVAHNGTVNERKICTNTEFGRSTCFGDFGAPLVTERNGKKVLIGVGNLKYRDGCTLWQPGVFTRVTSFLDWINETINETPPNGDRCKCICKCCHECDASMERDEL